MSLSRHYVQMIHDGLKSHGGKEHEIWDLFLKEAKEFSAADVDLGRSRKFAGRFHAAPKSCFFNSLKIAKKLPDYEYYEGFGTCMIPTEHAWIVTPEGKVIDVTWEPFFDGSDHSPKDYFGIAIPWVEAMENRKKNFWEPAWVRFLEKGELHDRAR